ncbi:MAG: Rieske (2Fe-2S) protein, partial [Nitrososphaerales archaeon]
DFDPKTRAQKSRRGKYSRFSSLCKLIEDVQPKRYIPSAGPACFLDGQLFHLNFDENGIFPHAAEFYDFWLKWKGDLSTTKFDYRAPGDRVFYTSPKVPPVKNATELSEELLAYHDRIEHHLKERGCRPAQPWTDTLADLRAQFNSKLDQFPLADQINHTLVICNSEGGDFLEVNFRVGVVITIAEELNPHWNQKRYVITAHRDEWQNLMEGKLTCYEWLLSLRFKVNRTPDKFSPLLDGFLVNEPEDLAVFCKHYEKRKSDETITVHTDRKTYKVCRNCPHEGADLSNGYIEEDSLVCRRHGWKFDLEDGGKCHDHGATINAQEVKDEQHSGS